MVYSGIVHVSGCCFSNANGQYCIWNPTADFSPTADVCEEKCEQQTTLFHRRGQSPNPRSISVKLTREETPAASCDDSLSVMQCLQVGASQKLQDKGKNSCIQLQKPAIRQIYGCWQVNSFISRSRWRESSCHGWHYDRLLQFISPSGCDSSDSAGFCCAQEDLNRSFTLKTTSGRGGKELHALTALGDAAQQWFTLSQH